VKTAAAATVHEAAPHAVAVLAAAAAAAWIDVALAVAAPTHILTL
jgi:hypothetical protein